MTAETVNHGIELVARSLELVGVAVIALCFAVAIARGCARCAFRKGEAYDLLKVFLGKSLLVGLEFLVAADIIRTVTVSATLDSLLSLGLLVVVRIVLGWSITIEIEGCWPWQVAAREKPGRVGSRQ